MASRVFTFAPSQPYLEPWPDPEMPARGKASTNFVSRGGGTGFFHSILLAALPLLCNPALLNPSNEAPFHSHLSP